MNLQTERIENHKAQLTIEIDSDQLEDAKRQAARKISHSVRIKGFRKGKAPYRVVAQYVGESAILEEALEALGDNLYKRALEESEIVPYGPGAFEDFKPEPAPTFVFTVPLQPEVNLKDFADVRLDFEEPEISDGQVEESLRQLRLGAVEVLDEDVKIAAPGNRVRIRVESEFVDGDLPDDSEDHGEDESSLEDAPTGANADDSPETGVEESKAYIPKKGDTFVHDENAVIILDPNEDPFTHGFVACLIGAELGSDIEFELTIPADDADETISGRRVSFLVTLNSIEAISIPELDDEFARRVSRNRGDDEINFMALRQTTRQELERSARDSAKSQYSNQVLQKIIEGAEIEFPDMMLEEQIDESIREFEGNLKQQGLNLEDYLRLTNGSNEELREQHRERATHSLQQTLVLRELISLQDIVINDEDVELRLDLAISGYGGSPEIRKLFDSPSMRGNLRNDLLMSYINEHLTAIGRGEDAGELIEALHARMASDLAIARERSERLQRYQAEDARTAVDDAATEPGVEVNENSDSASDEGEPGSVDTEGDREMAE